MRMWEQMTGPPQPSHLTSAVRMEETPQIGDAAGVLTDEGSAADLAWSSSAAMHTKGGSAAAPASDSSAVVLEDGAEPKSTNELLMRPCSQVEEPPQLLHELLPLPCSQSEEPPQSLHQPLWRFVLTHRSRCRAHDPGSAGACGLPACCNSRGGPRQEKSLPID
jgi:hypothetical protein